MTLALIPFITAEVVEHGRGGDAVRGEGLAGRADRLRPHHRRRRLVSTI